MSKHVTKLSATGDILLAEEYKDHYEKMDVDPETGKPGKYFVTAEEGSSVRATGLRMQLEPGERVIVGDKAYTPEATPDNTTVTTEEVEK